MKKFLTGTIFILLSLTASFAQISPGNLSRPHANLEGVSNCTKCHSVGNKVSNNKCLACHHEIQSNINSGKGFHASAEVKGKECSSCHNEHHGVNFDIIHFNKRSFDHTKTGFRLQGAHARQDCKACHKPAFIKDPKLKSRPGTYLGLSSECLNCHADYHQGRFSPVCTNCHSFETFKNPTSNFNHNQTRFPLLGQHKSVACDKCHLITTNGITKRIYRGLEFSNCTACHRDVHNNSFGQNCKQCHTEESFHIIKNKSSFDHDKTGFPLVGAHKNIACASCHKNNYSIHLKHDRCTDCHADYHHGEFTSRKGIIQDCKECHTNDGFTPSTFTIERHNEQKFALTGAHLATPCFACHKKQEHWSFKKIGTDCNVCHENIHSGFIDEKYMPGDNCNLCHNTDSWQKVNGFDHSRTGFNLDGAHAKISCAQCHFSKDSTGKETQKFKTLKTDCESCHKEPHAGQFALNGKTDCTRCHITESWKISKFDHSTSRFKLEGAHTKVSCEECHKVVSDGNMNYVQYKFKNLSCRTCHS